MSNKKLFVYASILFALLVAAYANHFNNGFHFDDSHAVQDNVHIRSLKNIPAFFSDPKMFSNDPQHWGLRPIVTTTLAIDYWLGGGLKPFYFQLDTFIWFVLLCIMSYVMYRQLLTRSIRHSWMPWLALIATAWYALHTANAETINYVISRSDVLSTFCIVASFLIYVCFPGKRKWYLYIIPAVIGVFAKETVLVLVILLFFYILLFEEEMSVAGLFKRSNFKIVMSAVVKVLPLFVAVAAVQIYTLSTIHSIPGITNPLFYYILTQSYVWLHYFITFFLPVNLSADTDWTVIYNVFDERIILGLLFVAALIIIIFKTSRYKETKPIAFGLVWFAAALLPTSLAPFAEITNDHRMFFPFIGLALSVVTAVGLWLMKNEQVYAAHQNLIIAGVTAVLLLNVYGVHERNKVWKTEETLWLDVTKKSPLNGRGLMNYGLTQMAKGNYSIADSYFTKALAYLPYYSTLYINIGVLKGVTNKPREAEENFKKAIAYAPGTFDPYIFYARYLTQTNRYAEALPLAEKALRLNPYSSMTLHILMRIYNNLRMWDKLQQTAQQTLAMLPGDTTARAYAEAGKKHIPFLVAASKQNKKALTAADYLNLSMDYYNQQQYNKCIEACLNAIKLKPDYADAYNNMGAAYNQLQQWERSIEACTKALQIDPHHQLAAGNLNWAKSRVKK
jgi:tetratricopeptide (TPR) repeat protein